MSTLGQSIMNKKTELSPTDERWRRFILDHLPSLIDVTETRFLGPDAAHTFRYRPDLYLERLGLQEVAPLWLVLLVNDMTSPAEFVGVEYFKVFNSREAIDRLLKTYRNYASQEDTATSELFA